VGKGSAPRGKTGSEPGAPTRRRDVPRKAKAPRPGADAVPPVESVDELIEATLRKVVAKGVGTPEATRDDASAGERAKKREEQDAALDARLTALLKKGVDALLDRKADKVVVLNLQGLTAMSDYFVIATATSDRQAQALADAVEEAMKAEGRRPTSVEGYPHASWILLDYGDVVYHVFHDQARRFYGLERLWGDAPDATAAFVPDGPPLRAR